MILYPSLVIEVHQFALTQAPLDDVAERDREWVVFDAVAADRNGQAKILNSGMLHRWSVRAYLCRIAGGRRNDSRINSGGCDDHPG